MDINDEEKSNLLECVPEDSLIELKACQLVSRLFEPSSRQDKHQAL